MYAQNGVEQACLALQQAGADVNPLLFCCWQGSEGRILNQRSLRRSVKAVTVWQGQVVQPLRHARRIIKQGLPGMTPEWSGSLRKRLARVELDAEYLEQLVLVRYAAPGPPATDDPEAIVAGNLTRYLELRGIPLVASITRHAKVLSGACG